MCETSTLDTPYARPQIRPRLTPAKTRKAKRQFEVARRTLGTFAGSCLSGHQPVSGCKIHPPTHPGLNPTGCQGTELQTESACKVTSPAAKLHHWRGGAGDQRGVRGLGHVGD